LGAVEGDPAADCDGGVFYDLDEALSASPDIVVVATPTSLHLPVLMASLTAGCSVFVEKPISHTLDGVDAAVALAHATRLTVAIGCQLRFHPALRELQRLLSEKVVGRLLSVQAVNGEYLPSYHPYEDYRTSYAARRDLGGGVLLTQIHELDYLQWMFGPPRKAYALGGKVGALEIDVEDNVTALLHHELESGPLAVQLHLDYLSRLPRRSCFVAGELGSIEVDLRTPSLRWTDEQGSTQSFLTYPDFNRDQLFLDEMRDFLDAVRSDGKVAVDLSTGAVTLRTAEALLQSIESGQVQTIR
jgi:predicted dehydrogenase